MAHRSGRHFLQIPGPTNVPDRVLRAIDNATMDHRGPEFAKLGLEVLEGLKAVFQTKHPVVIFPASGTGCYVWNTAFNPSRTSRPSLRSEKHTPELQSLTNIVCRPLPGK